MFDLFDKKESNKFCWGDIGNISEGRENLGESMPVLVYRLFQFTLKDVLVEKYGNDETIDIFRKAGTLAGIEFANNLLNLELELYEFIAHLQKILKDNKIGVLMIEKFDEKTGHAVLTISEDLDCSGLPITGETVCNYDEGFLAGILQTYTKKEYVVTEIDCWATGSRVCRFDAKVK